MSVLSALPSRVRPFSADTLRVRLWKNSVRLWSYRADYTLLTRNSLGRAMLRNLNEDIRSFYEHAEWCAEQAQTVGNKRKRREFLQLEEGDG